MATKEPPTRKPKPPAKKALPKTHAHGPFRCISIDGGPAALLAVMMLVKLEEKKPGLMAKTDLFVGTSSGSITALTLAAHEDPAAQLDDLIALWKRLSDLATNTVLGYLGALVGLNAVYSNHRLEKALSAPEFLGTTKMRDLKKLAMATVFDMSRMMPGNLSNFHPDLPGYDKRAVDVALSSSASPVFFPVHQGYVDGGVFANNPTMVAVSKLLAARRPHPARAGRKAKGGLGESYRVVAHPAGEEEVSDELEVKELRVLSLGGGRDEAVTPVGNANWGYLRWMFSLADPLLLGRVVLRGEEEIDIQARHILRPGHYHRLDPGYVRERGFIQFLQEDWEVLEATAETKKEQYAELVDQAAEWLDLNW